MDYSRRHLADLLAADYVMGTLRGPARRRFETLLLSHPALRQAVNEWQSRLGVLATDVPSVEPRPQVWAAVQARLFADAPATVPLGAAAAASTRWWQRLGLWQALTTGATAAAISLAVLLQQPGPVSPPIVVVLQGTGTAAAGMSTATSAQFVASISGDGRSLVLKPLLNAQLTPAQALELWALPASGAAPQSLGLIAADKATTVLKAALLKGTGAFAVSVEPRGGSPTGAPTGPVISVGKLQI